MTRLTTLVPLPATAVVVALALAAGAHAATEPTLAEERAFQEAVARVTPSVVRIEPVGVSTTTVGGRAEAAAATGPSTGTVVDPAGLIVTTSFAVPADATEAIVVLDDGTRRAARPLARDRGRGLVVLQTEPIPAAVAIEPVPRAELAPGQWTIAVGRGWQADRPGVAVGILSAVDRSWGRAVQTDAAVSPLNYGGPLLDIAGRVIGILAPLPADTAGMKLGTELYDAGIGFAVPFEDVMRMLPRLTRGEDLHPGVLGIGWRSRDEINGEPVIGSVRQGSPAARAGLAAGDRIVRVAGRPVGRIADVRHEIEPRFAGDEIEIEVEHQGGRPRETVRAALVAELPPWRRAVVGIVPAVAVADAASVTVGWVLPDGPAAKVGIVAGDVITAVADATSDVRVPTPDREALAGVAAGFEPGQRARLWLGGRRPREVTVVLTAPPGDLPADGPPITGRGPDDQDPRAEVLPLASADVADPPLAVVPAARDRPVGVLVFLAEPRGRPREADAEAWRAAVTRHGVAVMLPGSADQRRWGPDDVAGVILGLRALRARRAVDPTRIAVAGRGAGAGFAWSVADRLRGGVRGVALIDAALPVRAVAEPTEPGGWKWLLFGAAAADVRRRQEEDARRLGAAGWSLGRLPVDDAADTPAEPLCRWVSMLGLL